jgi:undecaprenyl phosphate-alpha-L-ara4N flippase subunit ArnF
MTSSLIRGYSFAASSILLATFAQLAMKWGMTHLLFNADSWSSLSFWLSVKLAIFFVVLGIFSYALSMLLWLGALSRIALNKVYPLLSVTYALVYVATISLPWFNEPFSILCATGIVFICVGVWLTVTSPLHES